MHKTRLAVLFPGIGYTCDKPLLYYGGRLAAFCGYELKTVPYGNFEPGIKGNPKKMEKAFASALQQAEEILREVDFADRELLFLSKSIGTAVAAAYAKRHGLRVKSVSFTPVEQTFLFAEGEGIMFHGTADPWGKDSAQIRESCERIGQRMYLVEGANHSLETGNVETDIRNLQTVMARVKDFIGYHFYGWETADVRPVSPKYANIRDPRALYDILSRIWCADTCAPRMRQDWTPENRTLGQCSVTAFLAQDVFGGSVYGIPRPGGSFHCYNVVGDRVFDLTSEQFGGEELSYEGNPEQFRETHFAKEEKRRRYEYLKTRLQSAVAGKQKTEIHNRMLYSSGKQPTANKQN